METTARMVRGHAVGGALRYWGPVVLYAGAMFYLSSLSHPEEEFPGFLFREVSDKVLHAVEYGLFAVLWYRAFRSASGPMVARHALLFAIVAASLYGITDEVHQAFVPLRESSWLDWLADTIGAVLGPLGWSYLAKR